MFTALALGASLAVTPVAETTWWNTTGGRVSEQHDERHADCTMTLYNGDREVDFTWGRNQPLHGFATQANWNFPRDGNTPVDVHFDGQKLGNRTGLVDGKMVVFLLDQPIDELLLRSESITVDLGSTTMSVSLPSRARMTSLVLAARRCREALNLPAG